MSPIHPIEGGDGYEEVKTVTVERELEITLPCASIRS
jgi:hypothetical protein